MQGGQRKTMKEFVHTKLEEQKNKQVDHVIVKQIVLT